MAVSSLLLSTLQEPEQPPALQLRRVSGAHLMFNLLIGQDAPERVPHDGEHAKHGREHASGHREYAFCVPAIILDGRPRRQARQIRYGCMAGSVARGGQILCEALLRESGGWGLHGLGSLLHLEWRFDEGHSETGLQVPFNVACRA